MEPTFRPTRRPPSSPTRSSAAAEEQQQQQQQQQRAPSSAQSSAPQGGGLALRLLAVANEYETTMLREKEEMVQAVRRAKEQAAAAESRAAQREREVELLKAELAKATAALEVAAGAQRSGRAEGGKDRARFAGLRATLGALSEEGRRAESALLAAAREGDAGAVENVLCGRVVWSSPRTGPAPEGAGSWAHAARLGLDGTEVGVLAARLGRALRSGCARASPAAVKLLLEAGAPAGLASMADGWRLTPLHWVCARGVDGERAQTGGATLGASASPGRALLAAPDVYPVAAGAAEGADVEAVLAQLLEAGQTARESLRVRASRMAGVSPSQVVTWVASASADDGPWEGESEDAEEAAQGLGWSWAGARGNLVDLDARDVLGRTPLVVACASNSAAAVRALLLQGADPWVRDDGGRAALSAAEGEAWSGGSAAVEAGVLRAVGERGGGAESAAWLRDASLLFWNASVRANRMYAERRFEEAIRAYSEALTTAPREDGPHGQAASPRDLATLHYNRARAAYRLGRHCGAIEDCDTALGHDARYRNALAQRAECRMSLLEFDEAARDFEALLEGDPGDRQWARRLHEARTMRDLSPYHVLGALPGSAPVALKRAYRQACLRWHPDKHRSTPEDERRANAAFRRVSQAWELLNDPFRKMMLDAEARNLHAPLQDGAVSTAAAAPAPATATAPSLMRWADREHERERERASERSSVAKLASDKAKRDESIRSAAKSILHLHLRRTTTTSANPHHSTNTGGTNTTTNTTTNTPTTSATPADSADASRPRTQSSTPSPSADVPPADVLPADVPPADVPPADVPPAPSHPHPPLPPAPAPVRRPAFPPESPGEDEAVAVEDDGGDEEGGLGRGVGRRGVGRGGVERGGDRHDRDADRYAERDHHHDDDDDVEGDGIDVEGDGAETAAAAQTGTPMTPRTRARMRVRARAEVRARAMRRAQEAIERPERADGHQGHGEEERKMQVSPLWDRGGEDDVGAGRPAEDDGEDVDLDEELGFESAEDEEEGTRLDGPRLQRLRDGAGQQQPVEPARAQKAAWAMSPEEDDSLIREVAAMYRKERERLRREKP